MLLLMLVVSHSVFAEAKISINGIDDSDLEKNVRLLLADVNAPLGRVNEDKFTQNLVQQIQKAVQAFGYYDAKINIEDLSFAPSSDENNGDKAALSFTVDAELGTIARIERVVLVNDIEQLDQSALPAQLKALVAEVAQLEGKEIDHQRYENLKNRLKTLALLYGYFDFNFVLHKLIVQPADADAADTRDNDTLAKTQSTAIIHWIFYLGERYQFGEINFLNDTRGQEIARSVSPFQEGEYFDQGKVGNYSIDMQSTDYFSSAIARANAQNAANYKVPIEVILDPKPIDTFEFGIGVSTDTGPRFTVDWSRPWVTLKGHSLGARLYLSNPRKSIQSNYRIPMANPLNDFLNFQIGFSQVDNNQTRSDTFSLAAQRQWGAVEEDEWDKIGFIKFEQESFIQGTAEKETTKLLLPGFTFTRTRKRGEILVSWGDLQQVTVEGGSKAVLSDIDFFKVIARTKWIRELGVHRFLIRGEAGAIATNNFDRVPSTQRFFAGGDQSIRGFGLNEISDFDIIIEDGEPQIELKGGKYLAVASLEYAYPVAEKFRVAAFVDAGNANDNPFTNLTYGFGLGVHWLSPIGTVRLYGARGVSEYENTFRIHLVIGPGL